jgi:hypothetical protein
MRSDTPDRNVLRLPLWAVSFALVLCPPAPAQEAAAPAAQVICDFDRVEAPVSLTGRLRLAETTAGGNAFVRVTAPDGESPRGQILYFLPDVARPGQSGGFSFRVRSVGGAADVRLIAADARGRVLLQRRLKVEAADTLQTVTFPWTQWRWGDDACGPPAEVRRIGLRFVSDGTELQLDDLALAAPVPGGGGREWLRKVAFGGRDVRMAEGDGVLVATDAVEGDAQLTDADLTRVLGRMRAARKLVRRLFGDAVRPIGGATPPALLIFRHPADFPGFWDAAGTEWNVKITPPAAGGYSVQNIATSTFDPRQGADRPVFLHEGLHAVFAEDVRLFAGHDRHSWLHEGLGTYVQLSVYPRSIDRRALAENFRRPIAADGSGFFKPLDRLLAGRVGTRQYAQLGTLVAYLIDQKPQWLPVIARTLGDGGTAEQAFQQCGTTLPELQDAWMKWGAEKVGADGDAGAMLTLPEEFAAEKDAALQQQK